jgi:urease accessory protein
MLKLSHISTEPNPTSDSLTLPFELRQKSRFSAISDNGIEVGIFLTRGSYLRAGTVLSDGAGAYVLINAAPETLSVVRCEDALLFARACYHLGNRHIALQILPHELRYLHDHVLDHLVEGLGLAVSVESLAFEPEAGAYHSHD